MKRKLQMPEIAALSADELAALAAATRALRATSNGKRRQGTKCADGTRYDNHVAQINREQKRRKREARMQDVAA